MDQREFPSSVPPAAHEALTARSDGPGLRHLLAHVAAIPL